MTVRGALNDAFLIWAVEAALPGGEVVEVAMLREPLGPWKLRIRRADDGAVEVVLKVRPLDWRAEMATEIAALRWAEARGLRAPRLVAEALDGSLGALAFVTTVIPGASRIPLQASEDRLRASGAAAATVHRNLVDPQAGLPLRTRQMPWIDFSEERRAGRSATTALLDEVDAFLMSNAAPTCDTVFVHGDLWQGNLLFNDDEVCLGIVDWEAAGAGHPGIDIGSLRWDAAILFGLEASDPIVAGWEAVSGRRFTDTAYWDLVAAANTPADQSAMVDAISQQGRPDLDGPTMNARRDAFLERALTGLR